MADWTPLRTTDAMPDAAELRQPVLVASFVRRNGFNSTATATLTEFVRYHGAEVVASIEADRFYDFSVTPPSVRSRDGRREIEWPKNEIALVRKPDGPHDVLALTGIEPHLMWPAFAGAILDFLGQHEIDRVVVLRTWPGSVPHTRPAMLRLTTTSEGLASALGLPAVENDYRGPLDFGGLLSAEHGNAGGLSGGLTAIVPNYLGVIPSPFAMLALTEVLDRLAGSETPLDDVRESAVDLRARADEEMVKSDEFREAVVEMERGYEKVVRQFTGIEPGDQLPGGLPPLADIMRDVERFLSQGGDR